MNSVTLIGASVRAAAFSALRAGLSPWCADLFADVDLRAKAPAFTVAEADYPGGFAKLLADAPPGPWMYTGALENRPTLVNALTAIRPLWGNPGDILCQVRRPLSWTSILAEAGIPVPQTTLDPADCDSTRRWLLKPINGAGGHGIVEQQPGDSIPHGHYAQERIDGESVAGLYIAQSGQAEFLGATRQINDVGFRYAGSVGPLSLDNAEEESWRRIGAALVSAVNLRGIFGIDAVHRAGVLFPVEINPRYTASVEVLEYATGLSVLGRHRQVFDPQFNVHEPHRNRIVGKRIVYAVRDLVFPVDGPWLDSLKTDVNNIPAFADIPIPGTQIPAGGPILTLLSQGTNLDQVTADLEDRALRLETIIR